MYYPQRELAGYIPAYLGIAFVFVPIMYMGLNVLSSCSDDNNFDSTCENRLVRDSVKSTTECSKDTNVPIGSIPEICDMDVRLEDVRWLRNERACSEDIERSQQSTRDQRTNF